MRKTNRIISLIIALFLSLGTLTACNNSSGRDDTKSLLNIGVIDDGYGTEWIDETVKDFCEYYSEYSFEEGKVGVQVEVLGKKDEFVAAQLQTTMPYYDAVLWFSGMFHKIYRDNNLIIDITDVVTADIYDENGNLAEATGKPAVKSIIDTMHTEYQTICADESGKYYSLPLRYSYSGITYDADLISSNRLFFLANGNIGANKNDIASGNCSNGPDGIKGTSDDGMPATYAEFIKWLDAMVAKGITPFTWSGDTDYQRRFAFNYFWANYEGAHDYALNFNFNGYETGLNMQISESNYYELASQEGRKAGIKFAYDVIKKPAYYSSNADRQTYTDAQFEYANSTMTSKPIAMFFEGSYWEAEARDTFDEMGIVNSNFAYGKRDLRWLPVPNFIGDKDVADQHKQVTDRVLPSGSSYQHGVAISARSTCDNYDVQVEIAKKFIQFAQTREQLSKFTKNTGGGWRPFTFKPTDDEVKQWTGVARSIQKFIDEGATTVSDFPGCSVRLNNYNKFTEGAWGFVDSLYTEPFAYFMYNPNSTISGTFSSVASRLKSNFGG